MRINIPEHIKSAVIDAWIMGKTRDNIASEFNISTGSVSNIIEQWQNRIGLFDANNLRELGLALKKAGKTPVQCADGLRIINIINQLGIDEDHLFDFLKKFYNESKEQKSSPADLVRHVKLINDYPQINSLNELPKYINKRLQEKRKLDADIYYKKLEIQKLDHEKERKRKEIQDLQDDLESSRKEMQDEKKDFLLFKNVKEELNKHDIDIHILDPLIDVIKIFREMHFRPLTILSEFSDINEYRQLVKNKDREIKQLESQIQNLKAISDNYEMRITSNEPMVKSLKQLENLGFDAYDIKNLHLILSKISKKYGLNEKEIKIRFFRCMNYYFHDLLPLQKDIWEKRNMISILDSEISSRRKIIEESQPVVFSILQYLINEGYNEHKILNAFKIFKTDLCNKMPYGDSTYLERLSKDLDRYPTVRDTLEDLNNKIGITKSNIEKLTIVKSNLEGFLFSLFFSIIYIYSIFLSAQKQSLKNLRILLIVNFSYLIPLILYIGIKKYKKSVESNFIKNRAEQTKTTINRKKKRKQEKFQRRTKKND